MPVSLPPFVQERKYIRPRTTSHWVVAHMDQVRFLTDGRDRLAEGRMIYLERTCAILTQSSTISKPSQAASHSLIIAARAIMSVDMWVSTTRFALISGSFFLSVA